MEFLLSIVVPFYCTPQKLFKRCMDSILKNTINNIEILVIDDGSPQDYQKMLDDISNDNRVRLIHVSNAGVSAARNRGIKEATGQWLTFIDSDDYINSETLQMISDNLNSFTGDIELFCGGLVSNERIIPNTNFLKENFNYGSDKKRKLTILESALSVGVLPQGYIQNFSLGASYCKIFNRKFLLENNLYFDKDVKFAEDTLFSLHTYQYAKSIFYHNQYFYNYVVNRESVTRKFRPGLSKDMDVFFKKAKDFLVSYSLLQDLEKAYYTRVQIEIGRCFYLEFFNINNNDVNAKKAYKEFIRKEPYRSALKNDYVPKNNYKSWIFYFLVKYGLGETYNFIRRLRGTESIN